MFVEDVESFVVVFIDFVGDFQLAKTGSVDVEYRVWDFERFPREVRNDPEGRDGAMEYGSVEFAKDIRSSTISRQDDEWPEIPRAHLPIKRFFDCRISHKDKTALAEVIVANCSYVFSLEFDCCNSSCLIDFRIYLREVFAAFLECNCSLCDKIGG